MTALDPHFTVDQISERWGLSRKVITRLFEDEPGVLRICAPRLRSKRPYVTLRIPESVLQRVHEARSGGWGVERRGRR